MGERKRTSPTCNMCRCWCRCRRTSANKNAQRRRRRKSKSFPWANLSTMPVSFPSMPSLAHRQFGWSDQHDKCELTPHQRSEVVVRAHGPTRLRILMVSSTSAHALLCIIILVVVWFRRCVAQPIGLGRKIDHLLQIGTQPLPSSDRRGGSTSYGGGSGGYADRGMLSS
jgi:hypothetical protein